MNSTKIFLFVAILTSVFASCQKMVSEDLDDDPPPIATDSTCVLSKIVASTPDGEETSLTYVYDAGNRLVNLIEEYDSTVIDWQIKFGPKRADFLHNQWVEFDDSGRVAKCLLNFSPYNPDLSDTKFIDTYTYNSEGYLTLSVRERAPNPNITYSDTVRDETSYTWSNGNLTRLKTVTRYGSESEMVMTYDLSATTTSNTRVAGDVLSFVFFDFFNLGKSNKNVVTSIQYFHKDTDGVTDDQGKENYYDYVFDIQRRVLSYKVRGSGTEPAYILKRIYKCF